MKPLNVKVKICGITNVDDARWAANLGADFIGLNFYSKSLRKISMEKAKEIVEGMPPFIHAVGVFVNPELSEIKKILSQVKLSVLQLHGDEPPELIQQLKTEFQLTLWKAIRIKDIHSLDAISPFSSIADTLVLDGFKEDCWGGTGENFDWEIALKAKERGIPIFLSGGLDPENVAQAIQRAQPAGVDVASGVEKEGHPRKKELEKMKSFIQRAKGQL